MLLMRYMVIEHHRYHVLRNRVAWTAEVLCWEMARPTYMQAQVRCNIMTTATATTVAGTLLAYVSGAFSMGWGVR
jgi:hypothetical protein